jgi:hypothetical protein
MAVKVDEHRPAAPADEPPRGHGRIDAAREQAHHAPAGPHRQAARAPLLFEVEECVVRDDLRVDRALGPSEVDGPSGGVLHAPADHTLDLGRRHGKPLVRAASGDAKPARGQTGNTGDDGVREGVEIGGRVRGAREVADPGQAREPVAHVRPLGPRAEAHFNPAHDRPHLGHAQVLQRRANRAHERVDEPRPVAALEPEFLVVDDDGGQDT